MIRYLLSFVILFVTLYFKSLHIKSAIPHPLILGVIRECGGKMHLREGEFEKVRTFKLLVLIQWFF
jgi:hypothetical protein